MAFANVQNISWSDAVGGPTIVGAFANNPTAGNLVVLAILYYKTGGTGTTITSVVDGNSNAYTIPAGSPSAYNTNAGQIHIAYLLVAPANADKTIPLLSR